MDRLRPELMRRGIVSFGNNCSPREYMMRTMLPYGYWTMGNGDVFLFNRQYENLVGRTKEGSLLMVHPDHYHDDIVDHTYFYDDMTSPWHKKKTYELCRRVQFSFIRNMPLCDVSDSKMGIKDLQFNDPYEKEYHQINTPYDPE